ncbi:MAG: succinate--CoA ligase subunit alpha [Limnochordaceae bacterium]|nr:succinate--CoA ligase subunit alpha [Limnochordaceae bacterium]
MGVLVRRDSRILVQGITGREGRFHTARMLAYGSQVVAGVTPGKGGLTVEGVPVFETVSEARAQTHADVSVVFVPAPHAADAVAEAAAAGLSLVICITEGVPILDTVRVVAWCRQHGTRLIGPNCPGIIVPGQTLAGILPGEMFRPGPVAVLSRSGTLAYEVAAALGDEGLGQSTCIGVGGDPVIGTRFTDLLPLVAADPATEAIVLIGEIGGQDENEAAAMLPALGRPVFALLAGTAAPAGKRMGHAGAIISRPQETVSAKTAALRAAGATVCSSPEELAQAVAARLRVTS